MFATASFFSSSFLSQIAGRLRLSVRLGVEGGMRIDFTVAELSFSSKAS